MSRTTGVNLKQSEHIHDQGIIQFGFSQNKSATYFEIGFNLEWSFSIRIWCLQGHFQSLKGGLSLFGIKGELKLSCKCGNCQWNTLSAELKQILGVILFKRGIEKGFPRGALINKYHEVLVDYLEEHFAGYKYINTYLKMVKVALYYLLPYSTCND